MKVRAAIIGGVLTIASLFCYVMYYFSYVVEKEDTLPSVGASESDTPSLGPEHFEQESFSSVRQVVDIVDNRLTPQQREDPAFQRVMKIMKSKSFEEQFAQQNPQTLQEFFQLLSALGATEFSDIDVDKLLVDGYRTIEADYKAQNRGKTPKDSEEAMTRSLVEAIEHFGQRQGMHQFMKNPENRMWFSARFKGDEAASLAWMEQASQLAKARQPSGLMLEMGDTTSASERQNASPVENLDLSVSSIDEDIGVQSAASDANFVTDDPCCPPLEISEGSGWEELSKEKQEQAKQLFDQYGTEEGLRRFREMDPEAARQFEQERRPTPAREVPSEVEPSTQ